MGSPVEGRDDAISHGEHTASQDLEEASAMALFRQSREPITSDDFRPCLNRDWAFSDEPNVCVDHCLREPSDSITTFAKTDHDLHSVLASESLQHAALKDLGTSHPQVVPAPRGHPEEQSQSYLAADLAQYLATHDHTTTGSDESSEGIDLHYQNSLRFPPRLPANAIAGLDREDNERAANNITAWISVFENGDVPVSRKPPLTSETSLMQNSQVAAQPKSLSSTPTHRKLEELWRNMKSRRLSIKDMKTRLRDQRKTVQSVREGRDAAENAFMQSCRLKLHQHRTISTVSHDLVEIERLFKELQSVRNGYDMLESNYGKLAEEVDEAEAELTTCETIFFDMLASTSTNEAQTDVIGSAEQGEPVPGEIVIDADLLGISPDGPVEEGHPLYRELMRTVAKFQNTRDSYVDLMEGKRQVDEEMTMFSTTHRGEPDEYLLEFLEDYQVDEPRLSHALETLEQRVRVLKDRCMEKRAFKKHIPRHIRYLLDLDFYPLKRTLDLGLDSGECRDPPVNHPDYPNLLRHPRHLFSPTWILAPHGSSIDFDRCQLVESPDVDAKGLSTLLAVDSKGDFLNDWLLSTLRNSAYHVNLLRSIFEDESELNIEDVDQWQLDVCQYWYSDGTSQNAQRLRDTVRSDISSQQVATPQFTEELDSARSDSARRSSLALTDEGSLHSASGVEVVPSGSLLFPDDPSSPQEREMEWIMMQL